MSQTVLVVEDDRELGKLLVRAITGAGYQCELLGDGEAALAKITADPPSVVLVDLLIPKLDGRSLLRQLASQPATAEVPVIAMSGVYRGRSTSRELRDAGAQGFLEKPFSTKDLIAHLHAVVGPPRASASSPAPASDAKAAAPQTESLAAKTPAEILWQAMSEGFSGALQFSKDKGQKVVILRRGIPALVRSNAAEECLGRRLMAAGRIDRETLQESLKRTKSDGRQQGQVLISMGAINSRELETALEEQARDKLLDILSWDEGKAWRQEGVDTMSYATPLEGWTPRLLVFRGVQRMSPERAKRALKPYASAKPVLSLEGLSREESEVEGIEVAIRASEGANQLSELLELHARSLFGLWVCGNLQLGGAPTAEPHAAPADEVGSDSEEVVELRRFLAELQEKDYFECLGVTQESPEGEIRRAFLLLAKKYHPDRYQDRPESVRSAASEIFTLLSTAHDTLGDAEARREYVKQLKHGGSEQVDRETLQRILGAEQKFSEAESLFKRRAYADAARLFKEVLDMEPEEAEYNAYYGWSYLLANGNQPEAAALAKQHLKKALSLAPKSVTSLYFLGLFHKACGEEDLAQKMFKKALEIQPHHVEAEREVRLMEMRKQKTGGQGAGRSGKSGGFFGLGRKK